MVAIAGRGSRLKPIWNAKLPNCEHRPRAFRHTVSLNVLQKRLFQFLLTVIAHRLVLWFVSLTQPWQ